MKSLIYVTGLTAEGRVLIGGVWTLWHQEGFPVEMSYLQARDNGWCIDWLEAMSDASLTNNLAALMEQVEAFLPADALNCIKSGFVRVLASGKTYEAVLEGKRKNGSLKLPHS